MKIGYVRTSSKDQNEGRQIDKMRELGIEERFLFVEKESGKNFNRPVYQAMKLALREGDLLYIDSIDRLGRNYDGIKEEWKVLTREIGVDVVALDMPDLFDSRKFRLQGDVGKLLEDQMLSLLAWVAEQELKKIKIRQREGIERAKGEGKYTGRVPIKVDKKQFAEVYDTWKSGKITAVSAMKELGLKPNTFYRRVKTYEESLS